MKTLHGIVSNESGRYTMASVRRMKRGADRISFSQWAIHNKLRALLLLHRGALCGLGALWRRSSEPAESGSLAAYGDNAPLKPIANAAFAHAHETALGKNLSALIPDDAFLCTLPPRFADPSTLSFVSVYLYDDRCEIGIIREKKLSAVFTMTPGSLEALESHLGRIQRYWNLHFPRDSFPTRLYLFNAPAGRLVEGFSVMPLSVKAGKTAYTGQAHLRALGCALAGGSGDVPTFPCKTVEPAMRMFGAAALLATAAVLVLTAFSILVPAMVTEVFQLKLKTYEARYGHIIGKDPEIQTVQRGSDSLARLISGARTKNAGRTQWARFLEAMGADRPVGLYFDKLGSEPVKGAPGAVAPTRPYSQPLCSSTRRISRPARPAACSRAPRRREICRPGRTRGSAHPRRRAAA